MKFSVCNLGCKVNSFESEAIASELEERGWQRVEFEDEADACVIFTCAVTNTAAAKSRKMLHRIKRKFPATAVVMVGCYVEVGAEEIPEADLIIGTKNKAQIPDYIESYMENHERRVIIGDLKDLEFDNLSSTQFENKTRAYLKIQDGCNQFCSYCIIPYVRGRERSMAADEVIAQAKLIASSYPEIVLTGIHTGRYGKEFNVSLASLMRRILREVPSLERLRISSIESSEIDDELIALMKEEPRIARHLHIPLQAGSDEVLKAMHRPYSTKQYKDVLDKVRKEIDDVAVSCDIIVGFPGESDGQFEETLAFLRECEFSFLHVFPYSLRSKTAAEKLQNHVASDIKKQRTNATLSLSKQLSLQYHQKQIGKQFDVLVEEVKNGISKGHASQYFPVYIQKECERGKMYRVTAKEIYRDGILGEIICD